ncbi:MAG: argonaute/piwi family protein [Desulfobacteria bacterium]
MSSEINPHIWLPEPRLAFHPDRASDRETHPLRGLLRFGPHSAGLVPDPIRVATLAPAGEGQRLYSFMKELNSVYKPTERKDYLPDWPGFHAVFGLHMRGAGGGCHVELDAQLETDFRNSPNPHIVLAERLVRAIQGLEARRAEFDVLFLYIPQRWAAGFVGGPGEDFDLHDHLKAATAARRLPVQLVREDKAISYPDRASVMWRVGLALYAKAGGVPWKLADTDPETAYIGISYAVRPPESDGPRFVTCCSQVFDAEGSGLEFVAYDAHEVEVQRDNPFLSRTEMFRVMTRSLDLYRRRHAGRSPRRVMIHKTTEFKRGEIDGCMEALHLCEAVDLVQVVEDVGWRGVRIDGGDILKRAAPAAFPVSRGTLLGLGPREALLWTHGDVRGIGARGSYFQGARSTPRPIRLVRHAGHGPWDDTARAVLGLSKMDWNNDALYDPLPVTIGYAKVLARVVKRMRGLGSAPYQFRFFM